MSEISQAVQHYADGDISRDELTAYFTKYRWREPSYKKQMADMEQADWWLAMEDRDTAEEKTWKEVLFLLDTGKLSREDYLHLQHAVDAAHGDIEEDEDA